MDEVNHDSRAQAEKFADLARELECDEREEGFDERLRGVAAGKRAKAGDWRVDFAWPHGHRANFYPDDAAVTWASSPVFSTPQQVHQWLTDQGCVQSDTDPEKWLDR